jgi:hypothetical protein
MMEPFPPPPSSAMVLMEEHTPTPGASSQGVGRGRRQRVLSESIKYRRNNFFFSLCVNYNNPLSVIGNDSQNCINSLTAIRVLAGTKNSRPVGYSRNSTKSTVNPNKTIPQI